MSIRSTLKDWKWSGQTIYITKRKSAPVGQRFFVRDLNYGNENSFGLII